MFVKIMVVSTVVWNLSIVEWKLTIGLEVVWVTRHVHTFTMSQETNLLLDGYDLNNIIKMYVMIRNVPKLPALDVAALRNFLKQEAKTCG